MHTNEVEIDGTQYHVTWQEERPSFAVVRADGMIIGALNWIPESVMVSCIDGSVVMLECPVTGTYAGTMLERHYPSGMLAIWRAVRGEDAC